jgi:3-hydroxyacyl-CoA dehydrogenase/enoyl-CoA hydratase/3-hydroxybutyryl-CoA epimerase
MNNIRYETDADGIALLTWDMPGRSMNVFNAASIADFAELTDRIVGDPTVKGAIITSGKPAFIAGADLTWLAGLKAAANGTPEQRARALFDSFMAVQTILRRLETAGKPVVAAINGTALGGGFELCLACHRRIVADNPSIRLGLPEAKLGLLPGAGGTQRTIRMLGPLEALPLLLEGRSLAPADAFRLGLVDAVVPAGELIDAARAWLREAPADAAVKPWDKPSFSAPGADPRSFAGSQAFAVANARQRRASQGNYPAHDAIAQVVYDGLMVPMDTALRIEVRYLVKLLLDPVAGNMIRTQFVNLQRANKLERRPAGVPKRTVAKVGVLGAGMMGTGIAHVSALAGINTVLLDATRDGAERARATIRRMDERAVAGGRLTVEAMEAAAARLEATDDYERLRGADLIVEAVFEDRAVKADVTRRAERILDGSGVFASNTSTLPISGLAEVSARPEHFIGLHFFSPVERMPLVEIITGRHTGPEALALALDYVRQIGKTPIVVNDGRGFYTSRVFRTYIREGMEMLCEGVAPALIENAGKATGMPMPPLALTDEVALDLYHQVRVQARADLGDMDEPMPSDRLIATMVVELKRLGKKVGKGFYDHPAGAPRFLWPGLTDLAPVADRQPELGELKTRFLAIQALETARCMEEKVVTAPADADIGAILGWGFAPWTGGPLSYIDTVGVGEFVKACDQLADRLGERFRPNALLRDMARRGESFHRQAEG